MASVTKKMAQPRVAESAKLTAEKKARKGKGAEAFF